MDFQTRNIHCKTCTVHQPRGTGPSCYPAAPQWDALILNERGCPKSPLAMKMSDFTPILVVWDEPETFFTVNVSFGVAS